MLDCTKACLIYLVRLMFQQDDWKMVSELNSEVIFFYMIKLALRFVILLWGNSQQDTMYIYPEGGEAHV